MSPRKMSKVKHSSHQQRESSLIFATHGLRYRFLRSFQHADMRTAQRRMGLDCLGEHVDFSMMQSTSSSGDYHFSDEELLLHRSSRKSAGAVNRLWLMEKQRYPVIEETRPAPWEEKARERIEKFRWRHGYRNRKLSLHPESSSNPLPESHLYRILFWIDKVRELGLDRKHLNNWKTTESLNNRYRYVQEFQRIDSREDDSQTKSVYDALRVFSTGGDENSNESPTESVSQLLERYREAFHDVERRMQKIRAVASNGYDCYRMKNRASATRSRSLSPDVMIPSLRRDLLHENDELLARANQLASKPTKESSSDVDVNGDKRTNSHPTLGNEDLSLRLPSLKGYSPNWGPPHSPRRRVGSKQRIADQAAEERIQLVPLSVDDWYEVALAESSRRQCAETSSGKLTSRNRRITSWQEHIDPPYVEIAPPSSGNPNSILFPQIIQLK